VSQRINKITQLIVTQSIKEPSKKRSNTTQ